VTSGTIPTDRPAARGLELFRRAPEDAGIAGFQPHDPATPARFGDDGSGYRVLRTVMRPDGLAHMDPLGIAARLVQNIRINLPVMQDHVCFLQVFDGATCQRIARGALEHPGPEGAAHLPGHAGADIGAQAPGQCRQAAEVARQHALQPGLDLAGHDRSRALAADGDDDRVAVDQRGRGHVAQFGLIDHVDRTAIGPGQSIQAGVDRRAAGADEGHGGLVEQGRGDGPRVPVSAAIGDHLLQLGVKRRGSQNGS
jgi:hypothetical protein